MPRPVVQLFVNPGAGSASRARLVRLRRALEDAGAEVLVSPTGTAAPVVDEAASHVCAVGGDGTLRHVAGAVARAGRPVRIGVYPAGTVNLIARECGYGRDPAAFAARLLGDAGPRLHHSGLVGDVPLFGCASVGPDSRAVAALSLRLKRLIGRAAYGVAFLAVLARWPRPQIRVTHDGGTIACEAAYVAKGRFFAGPWSFAPEAAVDVPLLHVVALRQARRRDFVRFIWTLWRGQNPAADPNVVAFTCTTLAMEGDPGTPLQADGDIVAHLPARITLAPDPLPFA